ncbi:hypothetical protein VPH35_087200 [Triticum aestivum]
MRLMLPDTVRVGGPPGVLGRAGDGDHHGHELLPGVPLPLRPQRHRLRRHGQGRPQRRAPPRRHHRHAVQEGAVPVPGADGDVPRTARVEPVLPGDPGGVRERRRRRGPGPLLAAHHQRVRQDARRRPGHPRRLGAQRDLQLHHPVRLAHQILIHNIYIYIYIYTLKNIYMRCCIVRASVASWVRTTYIIYIYM